MSIKRPSLKHRRYAYNLMNTELTKKDAALDAGYSESASRIPQRIEMSRGFNLAMASLAGQAGNVAMKVLHELESRDLKAFKVDELLHSITVISNAFDKFSPKQANKGPIDDGLDGVFGRIIPIEAVDTTSSDGVL